MNRERIISSAKKSVIGKTAYYIRDIYRCPNMLKLLNEVDTDEKIVILLGTSTFNNLGDHLISCAQRQFLSNLYPNHKLVEIPTQMFFRYQSKLLTLVRKEVPVFISGGGWMGSVWPEDEYRMQAMISSFNQNNITILPQTVYYDLNDYNALELFNDAKKSIFKLS